ncbi:replication protein [Rhodococcus sp. NPDC003318]|uniref:replication protein n=1 Tax=Rhodococcus sp. NPDC003318 TaxID=3364503 RepID=UPI0036CBDEE9
MFYSPRLLRYRGSTPANPRYGTPRTPRTLASGHVHGHQCTGLTPLTLTRLGGPHAACARYCRVALELGDGAYGGIARWRGEQVWVECDVRTAYQRRYLAIRPQLDASVSLDSVLAVARVMAKAADWETGQNSRLTVATIVATSGLGERTVQRARTALRLLGVATEVLRGRLRRRTERMASWRVGDRARGWASVYALHPTRPVDKTRVRDGNSTSVAPHPRRGRFSSLLSPLGNGSFTNRAVKDRAASRRNDTSSCNRLRVDQKGALLAARWLRDKRAPIWARDLTVNQWSLVLADAAEHGWTGADLNDVLDQEARRLDRALTPTNPRAFVRWLLTRHDLQFPPHILDEAARAQDAAERAERRRAAAAALELGRHQREVGRAAASGTARAAAMAAVPDAASARRRRAQQEAVAAARARAELDRRR